MAVQTLPPGGKLSPKVTEEECGQKCLMPWQEQSSAERPGCIVGTTLAVVR